MIRRPPRSTRTDTLFPYTTLFRSEEESYRRAEEAQVHLLEYSLAVHLAREPQRLVAKLPGTLPTRAKRHPEVQRIGRHLRSSEERRVGTECGSPCKSLGYPYQ